MNQELADGVVNENQAVVSSEDLLRLAERVEKLEGSDRKVDARICIALGLSRGNVMAGADGWCINSLRNPNPYKSPSYTASIDVAMTLVPEGLSFEVRSSGTGDKGQATIWNPLKAVGQQEWRVTGCKTPALALCAAAIRARASIGKGE